MDLLDAICGRRAIRTYKEERISEDIVRKVIDAGTWAPSPMNGQAWHFTVVTDPGLLDAISDHAKTWLLQEPSGFVLDGKMRSLLQESDFHLFHHAPCLIVISAPIHDKWTAESCALAAENLMLAATALGLGSCWIGLAQDWLNTVEGHNILGLPPSYRVIAPIAVGYPREKPLSIARKSPTIVWMREGTERVEERADAAATPHRGLYGVLIHP